MSAGTGWHSQPPPPPWGYEVQRTASLPPLAPPPLVRSTEEGRRVAPNMGLHVRRLANGALGWDALDHALVDGMAGGTALKNHAWLVLHDNPFALVPFELAPGESAVGGTHSAKF